MKLKMMSMMCWSGVFGNKYSAKRAWWENEQEKKKSIFCVYKIRRWYRDWER